jgi:hypothetical protein
VAHRSLSRHILRQVHPYQIQHGHVPSQAAPSRRMSVCRFAHAVAAKSMILTAQREVLALSVRTGIPLQTTPTIKSPPASHAHQPQRAVRGTPLTYIQAHGDGMTWPPPYSTVRLSLRAPVAIEQGRRPVQPVSTDPHVVHAVLVTKTRASRASTVRRSNYHYRRSLSRYVAFWVWPLSLLYRIRSVSCAP